MNYSLLNDLLLDVLKRVTAAHSELSDRLNAYLEARARCGERDDAGKLTQRAHEARAYLRSPLLTKMPWKRSERELGKQVRKRKAIVEKRIAEAILAAVEYDQFKTEYDIVVEAAMGSKSDVEPSREAATPSEIDARARPFIEALVARGIAPSTIGRLPVLVQDLIAKLIICYHRDAELTDPANPWVQMLQGGILDAFLDHPMSPEMAKAIDYARSLDDPQGETWAKETREHLGLGPGLSTEFLRGLHHLRGMMGKVTEGTGKAYATARNLTRSDDAAVLGKLLGMTDDADMLRLQTVVDFVRNRTHFEGHDSQFGILLIAVKLSFEKLSAHERSTADWASDAIRMVTSLATDLDGFVPGTEAFDMLLRSGFQLTETHRAVEERRRQEREEREEYFLKDALDFIFRIGGPFKVEGSAVFGEDDDGFDEIEGPVWDKESWIAAHGPLWPDVEDAVREDDDFTDDNDLVVREIANRDDMEAWDDNSHSDAIDEADSEQLGLSLLPAPNTHRDTHTNDTLSPNGAARRVVTRPKATRDYTDEDFT